MIGRVEVLLANIVCSAITLSVSCVTIALSLRSSKTASIIRSASATDFKSDTTGNARIGYCSNCGKNDFYDKFQIHMEQSRCCGVDLKPSRS